MNECGVIPRRPVEPVHTHVYREWKRKGMEEEGNGIAPHLFADSVPFVGADGCGSVIIIGSVYNARGGRR